MHLTRFSYALAALVALVAIAAAWSAEPLLAGSWRAAALVLLAGLALESALGRRVRIALRVDAPTKLRLGYPAIVQMHATATGAGATRLRVAPALPALLRGDTAPRDIDFDAAGCGRVALTVRPLAPGQSGWPAARVRLRGPLGLAWWDRTVVVDGVVGVVPQAPAPVEGALGAWLDAAPRPIGAEALVERRAWRSGDPPGRIDWKLAARGGPMMTRLAAPDRRLDLCLAIDIGAGAGRVAGDVTRFVRYVNLAAALVRRAAVQDDRVGLVAFGAQPRLVLPPAAGPAALGRLERALATLGAEDAPSDLAEACAVLRRILERRALIVFLADPEDGDAGDPLGEALRRLAPPHLVLFAALEDPAVSALAGREVEDDREAWVALAARAERASGRRRAAALRRRGASVVLAPDARFEAAVLAELARQRRGRRAV